MYLARINVRIKCRDTEGANRIFKAECLLMERKKGINDDIIRGTFNSYGRDAQASVWEEGDITPRAEVRATSQRTGRF